MTDRNGIVFERVVDPVHLVDHLTERGWLHLLARGAIYVDARRVTEDRVLNPEQILRVHTRPKRYPVPSEPLRDRVVYQDDDVVVLDKPSGLPTHATLDNALENAASILSRELDEQIFVTHRLDVPTDGLLILARTKDAQSRVNREFAKGRVEKFYVAVAARRIESGDYRHFIDPAAHVPRPIRSEPTEGWWDCRLVVDESGPLAEEYYWHRVRPLTGKTHQIRAQFSALGAPLRGDEMYGAKAGSPFGLTCQAMTFNLRGKEFAVRRRFDITTGS